MELASKLDSSVNFVEKQLEGFLESRYVRKCPEYFICYLSSQSGCNKGCKFCHLTTTKQTKFEDATHNQFLTQATQVLEHYNSNTEPAKYMHYNFMARGEVLSNQHILNDADSILFDLGKLATRASPDLSVKFNVSTILPRSLENRSLASIFKIIHPTIYYSLYSTKQTWRTKWLPQAMCLHKALGLLNSYQKVSKKTIKIHHCWIEGENDSESDVVSMCEALQYFDINYEFNLVRYNPFSELQGQESSQDIIDRNLSIIKNYTDSKVQVIKRVGFDVNASCGMFVKKGT